MNNEFINFVQTLSNFIHTKKEASLETIKDLELKNQDTAIFEGICLASDEIMELIKSQLEVYGYNPEEILGFIENI
jgi:hypothetical protein